MSDAVQLALVGAVVLGAAVYLVQRWRRPERACDACPAEPAAPSPLVQLRRSVKEGARRPPSSS